MERHLRGRRALPSQLAIKTSFSPSEEDIELLFHPNLEYLQLLFVDKVTNDSNTWWAASLLRSNKLPKLAEMSMRYVKPKTRLPRNFPKLCFSSTLCSTLRRMNFWSLHYLEKECILLGRVLPSLSNLQKFSLSSGYFHRYLGGIITAVFRVPEFFLGAFVQSHKSSLFVLKSICQSFPRKRDGERILVVLGQNGDFDLPLQKLIAAAIEKCPDTKVDMSALKELRSQGVHLFKKLGYMFR